MQHVQVDGKLRWLYGCNLNSGRRGWIPNYVVAPEAIPLRRLATILPPAPPAEWWADGSTDVRQGIAAAGVEMSASWTRWDMSRRGRADVAECSWTCPGFFVGATTSELVAAYLVLSRFELEDAQVRLLLDSENAVDYLNGADPVTPEGRKLLPLIALCRRLCRPGVSVEWRSRKENRAHALAKAALQRAQSMNWRASHEVDAQLLLCLRQVEADTRRLHPW